MKHMKLAALAMAFGLGLTVLPTGLRADDGDKDKIKPDLKIAVVAKGFQHQFWRAVEQGTKQAAEEFGIETTFQGPDNESAIAQQVEYLNAAIEQDPSAICLAALDTKSSLDAIKNAQEKNIPIVGFDSGVPDAPKDAVVANAATNNYAAAELAAEHLYELVKDKVTDPEQTVRIGVVSQEANSFSISERTRGFIEKFAKLVGEDKVSVEGHESLANPKSDAKVIIDLGIPAEVKDSDAVAVAQAILEKEDLIAIYASNEFTANALISANEGLDKLGKDKILAVGFDAGKKQLDAIRSELFVGSITQNPVQIGYQAVRLAALAASGEKVEDVDTGALWYTKDNMEDKEIAPCLYE